MNINWNAKGYTEDFKFVHQYGEDVLNLLDIENGMKILDLGCGNGALTKKIADMGADVIGIDASKEMLDVARNNYPEIIFRQDDAVGFTLHEQVDAIFSNAVFHWINNHNGLLESIYNGLKMNGYLVCEFGGHGCVEAIHSALQKSFDIRGLEYKRTFYFPTIEEYTPILKRHGLQTVYATLFDRKTALTGENGMKAWIEMFVTQPFQDLEKGLKDEIITETVESLKPVLYEDGVWYADYVRIRLKARKINEVLYKNFGGGEL